MLALISGQWSAVLPVITGLELAYLGMLVTHPRFQKVVDANVYNANSTSIEEQQQQQLRQLRDQLTNESWRRFCTLREQCLKMCAINRLMSDPSSSDNSTIDSFRTDGLDRLLGMFVKLLYSKDALERLLTEVKSNSLSNELKDTESRLTTAKKENRSEQLIRALEDKAQTLHQRIDNREHAKDSRETVEVELDRIEQKIFAISESSMNGHGADLSAQVDSVSTSIATTEATIRDLNVSIPYQNEGPRLLRVMA